MSVSLKIVIELIIGYFLMKFPDFAICFKRSPHLMSLELDFLENIFKYNK